MSDTDFASLNLIEPLQRALGDAGYEQPTPIQQQAIPVLLTGADLLGIAQTGTGKTAAFSLPLLHHMVSNKRQAKPRAPLALILAPTRELALQISEEIAKFGKYANIRQVVIFGGVGQNPQVKALARGIDVLIATPGRLLDLAAQKHVNLGSVEFLVLDEADRLLDMGFVRDVRRIVSQTPRSRQSLLFSATMPKEVAELAKDMLKNPQRVEVTPKQVTVKRITQKVVMVENGNKRQALAKLLRMPEVSRAIIFTRTKHGANKVAKHLEADGISAVAIHGNKSQNARQRALAAFKSGDVWALVATDIAARGIDIDGVSHVINHELPHEPESYVHRIGRTGRAGASGIAWSLVDPTERPRLKQVERLIRFEIDRETLDLPPPPPRDPDEDRRPARAPQQRSRRSASSGGSRSASSGSRPAAGGNGGGNSTSSDGTKPKRRRRRRRKPSGAGSTSSS
ncbi:MAG: DEAD/DEAH box helicase [Pseudomonadales bacterium]